MEAALAAAPVVAALGAADLRLVLRAPVRRLPRHAHARVRADRLVDRVPVGRLHRRLERHRRRLAGAVARVRSPRSTSSRSRSAVPAIYLLRRMLFAPFGYALRAGRDSPLRVRRDRHRRAARCNGAAFIVVGGFAGLAGGLFAFSKGSISPDSTMAVSRSIDALVMVLLGGVQTLSGPVVGAAVFTWLQDTIARNTDYWRALLGGTILAIVLLFPQGIVGGPARPSSSGGGPNERRARGRAPRQGVRRRAGGARRELRRRRRRAARADRTERRGQDHLLQHAERAARGRRRERAIRRARGPGPRAAAGLAARRRPHVPDHRDLRLDDGARERADRAALAPSAAGRLVGAGGGALSRRGRPAARAGRDARPGRARLLGARVRRPQAGRARGRARQRPEAAADGRADRRDGAEGADRADGADGRRSCASAASPCSSPSTTWTSSSPMPTASSCSTAGG